jgi:hypothetical protein
MLNSTCSMWGTDFSMVVFFVWRRSSCYVGGVGRHDGWVENENSSSGS